MSETVPTAVADYHHLRLMAEWSSSLRERRVGFAVREGALWLDEADPRAGEPALRVPAATPGRSGAVRSLALRVHGADAPLELAPYGVDALVWSEAAVEKFLVPYYASCAGPRAGRFLTALFDAWNGDHGTVRPVALAHLSHAGGDAPLGLANTLGVVYLREGEGDRPAALEMLPLALFRARHPEPWHPTTPPARETVELGARALPDGARLPTYPELRGIAEWAASLRGRTAYLEFDASPPGAEAAREGRTARVPAPGTEPTDRIVFPVHTPLEVPHRPKPVSVTLEGEDGGSVDLFRDPHCDALFTSTGAIEQLLVPYYASVRGVLGMRELRQVYLAWAGVEPEAAGARTDGGLQPLALVHLPHSDWTTGEETTVLEAGSPLDHVGAVDGAGRVIRVRERAGREG
jgi:hypothetical protein